MVDDNRDLCQVVQTALERDGHRVETRLSGAELTEQLCRWADCILLDVMMPGEDGFAVCRRIRGLTDAPILFLTAGQTKRLFWRGWASGQTITLQSLSGWQSCVPGCGASAAAEPHPGASVGARRGQF